MNPTDYDFDTMLVAAYAYYWSYENESSLTDFEYDALTKKVYENREYVTRPYKDIVDWEALKTCSSLHYIPKNKYPAKLRS